MIKKHKRLFLLLLMLIVAAAGYRLFKAPTEEEKIEKTLREMATLADKPEEISPAEFAVKLKTLQRVFAENVTIEFGAHRFSDIRSRRSLEPLLINFREHFAKAGCSISDIEINITNERASVVFACRFIGRPKQGAAVDEIRDVTCQLVKLENKWYIERVSINDILER